MASAAICAYMFDVETFIFTGPNSITRSEVSVTERDIVCDLPYPLVAGLWFDHHVGNLAELDLRGIDPNTIPGAFADKPSCCRVVFDYYSQDEDLPDDFQQLALEADIIDAFQYSSVEEWRRETPAKIIDWAIKAPGTNRDKYQFLRKLVIWLRDTSLEETSQATWVTERVTAYQREEEWMLKFIPQVATFLPQDTQHEIVVLDMTQFSKRERMLKNLALLNYPEALAFLEIQPQFQGGVRTTNLSFSMSLSLNLNDLDHAKDVGGIMRELNLGDGHTGAGAGLLSAANKQEMLKKKQETLEKIFTLWSSQHISRKSKK